MRNAEQGFNLVELLIVVTILGVAAVVAIPDISTSNPAKLDLAAEEIAQAIRFARSEAIRKAEPRGFIQQATEKRIRVYRPDTSASPWSLSYDVYHPVSKQKYDIDFNASPFARVDTVAYAETYFGTCIATGSIYFDAKGIAHCIHPNTVLLNKFAVTLKLGNHARIVSLNGITGRVVVQ